MRTLSVVIFVNVRDGVERIEFLEFEIPLPFSLKLKKCTKTLNFCLEFLLKTANFSYIIFPYSWVRK